MRRAIIAIALGSLLLAGCTSAAESESAPAEQDAAVQTPTPLPLLEGPMGDVTVAGPPADDYEQRILATGLDEGTAFFLSQTTSTVDVIDGHTFVVTSEFPNGATGEATYRLFAPATMSPDDPPTFEWTVEGDEFRYRMTYAVDASVMPADLVAQITNGLPTAAPAAQRSGATVKSLGLARTSGIVTAEDGVLQTIGVLVDGLISQTQESVQDAFVEAAEKKGITSSATSNSWNAFKAGKKVWDAIDANGIIADALAELAALEKCAQNPTNPLTKSEYKSNPAAKQQVLDTIADARAETKANAAVLFSSLIMDTASGAVKNAPWLGFIVSPAVNYTKETLLSLVKAEVDRARQAVTKCESVGFFIGSIGGKYTQFDPFSGPITENAGTMGTGDPADVCDITVPFTLTRTETGGQQTFTPTSPTGGTTTYSVDMPSIAYYEEGKGTYTLRIDGDTGEIRTKVKGYFTYTGSGLNIKTRATQIFEMRPTDACS